MPSVGRCGVWLIILLALVQLSRQQSAGTSGATAAQKSATSAASGSAATKASAEATAKPVLPSSYWAWQGKAGQRPSYSVIIPAHNTASRIQDTLRSVQASIEYFQRNGGKQFPAEVVVVDDASTDNTAARVMSFIEQQRRLNVTNPRWKLVSMQQNVLGGSARNFGVRESSGDVLFFCDSDDLYLERHIAVAFSSLVRKPTVAMIQTHAKIELENIHPKWKEKVEGTIPLTRCLWRKVHEFMEGYPEQGVFTRHQDVGYLLAFAATGAPMAIASEETVVYKKYPGNSLEQQAVKFTTDPKLAPKSPEEQTEEHPVRMSLINLHSEHIKRKVQKLLNGEQLEKNPLWAIYQRAADAVENGQSFVDVLNIKMTKFRRLVDTAEHHTFAGNQEEAKKVFNIVHKFVYNSTQESMKPPEPLYFVISS